MFRRSDLVRIGHTQDQIDALVRAGRLVRVRRGVYASPSELSRDEERVRAVLATAGELRPGTVISHASAAILHGLPVPQPIGTQVWVTREGRRSSKVVGKVKVHHARLDADEVVRVAGVLATSVERTVVDVATRLDFPAGVALVDAALRAGADLATLHQALDRARGTTGIARAREVVAFGDARSESPGESRSRALMFVYGVPAPELQHELSDDDGLIGRVDFWWDLHRLVGEFDGKIKYSRDLAPHGDPVEAVFAEKRREDRIRRKRCGVARWTWHDLDRPRLWATRLLAALREARIHTR